MTTVKFDGPVITIDCSRATLLPTYIKNPRCFNSHYDVLLRSRKNDKDEGLEVSYPNSRLVLASVSPHLRQLLTEHERNQERLGTVNIWTEVSAEHLELFSRFSMTGCLDERHYLDDEVKSSFRSLGVDLDELSLVRTAYDEHEAGGRTVKTETLVGAEDCLPREAVEMARLWEANQVQSAAKEAERISAECPRPRERSSDVISADDDRQPCEMAEVAEDVHVALTDFESVEERAERNRESYLKTRDARLTKKALAEKREVQQLKDKRRLFRCDVCPYMNYNSFAFAHHVVKAHKSTDPKHQSFCPFCEAGFETTLAMKQHEAAAHPDRLFQCQLCPEKFNYLGHRFFLYHVASHCDTPQLVCPQCGLSYKDSHALHMHMSNAGPYHNTECVQCPPGAYTLLSWTEHLKHLDESHGGVMQHVCGICPELFDSKELRKSHAKLKHPGGVRPVICHICGLEVAREWRKRHLYKVHQIGPRPVSAKSASRAAEGKPIKEKKRRPEHLSLPPFAPHNLASFYTNMPCEVCQEPQVRKQSYLEHFVTRHLPDGEKPFQCSHCIRGFPTARRLLDHQNTHTNAKPYKCRFEGCDAAFSNISNRTPHEHAVHRNVKRKSRVKKAPLIAA